MSEQLAENLTIGFTTIDRPEQCKAAVKYLRESFPGSPIVVADQNTPCSEMRDFYDHHDIVVAYVGEDIGLSAARNRLMSMVETKYLLLCDDDISGLCVNEVERSIDFMSRQQDVLAVGGRAEKMVQGQGGWQRRVNPDFDYFILGDAVNGYVSFQSVHKFGLQAHTQIEPGFFLADVVENFVIFNVPLFGSMGLRWDERIKIKNEHLDFYLSLKKSPRRDDCRIVYNPNLIATEIDGMGDSMPVEYKSKRTRNDYTSIYCEKWGLRQEFHIGKWINIYNGHRYVSVPWEKRGEYTKVEGDKYKSEGEITKMRFASYEVDSSRITFIATTMKRYEVAESFVISVRRFFPESPIVLGVQSDEIEESLDSLSSRYDVDVLALGEDVGLSRARNLMLSHVETDYFVLCDDDFVVDEQFFLNNAFRVLEEHDDIGVVGGYYRDILYDGELNFKAAMERQFTMRFEYERHTGTLVRIPFTYLRHEDTFDLDTRCVPVDCVNNLALFRRSIFDDERVRWDDRMKISGEHIDFYFSLYRDGVSKVVYDPSFSVIHNRRQNTAYTRFRSRREGLSLFYDKWGIKNEIDFDLGVKVVDNSMERWVGF